jgi:hypothetical protein
MQDIVAEAADWLTASELSVTDARIAATPLAVWNVQPGVSLRDAAKPSGEWHHQVRRDGHAFASVRSRINGDRGEIIELSQSSLSKALEATLEALRPDTDDTIVLRLLRSQKHHTTWLWLHKEDDGTDEAIVLQSPTLTTGMRVDEPTFLRMLAALPGPGITVSRLEQRYRDIPHWGKRLADTRTKPVRRAVGS